MDKVLAIGIYQLNIGYKQRGVVKTVAKNIEAEVLPGKLVALVGPNGAGKSTLLRTISGLQAPLSGQTDIHGKSVEKYTAKELAHEISIVLTEKPVTGNLTVEALVALGRFPYTGMLGNLSSEDKQKINWALEATGLLDFRNRNMMQLSDGERQKVMIARALAQDTPVIVLDEPTAFLDVINRVEVLRLLSDLAKSTGKSILLSTHDLQMALQVCDDLWVLDAAGNFYNGPAEEMVNNGTISKVFENENVRFDTSTKGFKIIK
jgi:iron complex transport system ATP-binding protein